MLRFRAALPVRRPGFAATFGNELIFAVSVRTAVSARTRGWRPLTFCPGDTRASALARASKGAAHHGEVSLRQIRDPRGDRPRTTGGRTNGGRGGREWFRKVRERPKIQSSRGEEAPTRSRTIVRNASASWPPNSTEERDERKRRGNVDDKRAENGHSKRVIVSQLKSNSKRHLSLPSPRERPSAHPRVRPLIIGLNCF